MCSGDGALRLVLGLFMVGMLVILADGASESDLAAGLCDTLVQGHNEVLAEVGLEVLVGVVVFESNGVCIVADGEAEVLGGVGLVGLVEGVISRHHLEPQGFLAVRVIPNGDERR